MSHKYALSPYQLQESAFTRQHYEAVAAIIKKVRSTTTTPQANANAEVAINRIMEQLADYFKRDNPRFDVGFFINKCD